MRTVHSTVKILVLTVKQVSNARNDSHLFTLLTKREKRYAVRLQTCDALFHKPRSSRNAI